MGDEQIFERFQNKRRQLIIAMDEFAEAVQESDRDLGDEFNEAMGEATGWEGFLLA